MEIKSLIRAENIKKYYKTSKGFLNKPKIVKALDGVSVLIKERETVGLVGESGSGKSTLGRIILRLIEPDDGSIFYKDTNITYLKSDEMRKIRHNMQMIFQDPYSSLNPRMTIEQSLTEPFVINKINKEERKPAIKELLECVGLTRDCLKKYPHEFSGGQRQRIVIARALALKPSFIVADEPVSALDVSIQAQILNLLLELQERFSLSFLFISHDLSVVKYMSSKIAVMYMGHIVEEGDSESVCSSPFHPYTKLLLSSLPENIIENSVNHIRDNDNTGECVFYNRCNVSVDKCKSIPPPLLNKDGHKVMCHNC